MQKKGAFDERIYLWLFYTVMILMIFVYFYGQVQDQITFKRFKDDFYTRDVSLIIDSIHETYLDYNLSYNFDENKNINFNEYKSSINDKRYYYTKPDFNLNLNTNRMELKNG